MVVTRGQGDPAVGMGGGCKTGNVRRMMLLELLLQLRAWLQWSSFSSWGCFGHACYCRDTTSGALVKLMLTLMLR